MTSEFNPYFLGSREIETRLLKRVVTTLSKMIEILHGLSVGILGIFVGTQIAEGALFVPYWKKLPAAEFFALHKTYGPKIYKFFAPITMGATFIPVVTAVYSVLTDADGQGASIVTAVLCLMFFFTYPIYFKRANQAFADASLSEAELPRELIKWGKWHWARVYMELGAFSGSIVALSQSS